MRILIVEDEEYNQIVLTGMIEILYPHVSLVVENNGAEAMDKLLSEPFDMLISDVDMPVMDGYELVKAVQSAGLTLPMICITAFAITGDREKLLNHGFDRYLAKPINMDELKSLLDYYIH